MSDDTVTVFSSAPQSFTIWLNDDPRSFTINGRRSVHMDSSGQPRVMPITRGVTPNVPRDFIEQWAKVNRMSPLRQCLTWDGAAPATAKAAAHELYGGGEKTAL